MRASYEIRKILSFLLNGHCDLAIKILNQMKNTKLEENRLYHIEKDFYNWLNHDRVHRQNLRQEIQNEQYYTSRAKDHVKYHYMSDALGINSKYRRTKSLTSCFNSKWWATNCKTGKCWRNIHKELLKNVSQ